MHRLLSTCLLGTLPLLGLFGAALPAQAQSYGYADQGTIRCESNDSRQQVCATGWRDAQLVRQLSKTQCVEGRNWGSRNGNIWVSNGCRAEFTAARGQWGNSNQFGGPGSTIRCESNDNRQRACNTGWRNAQLVRQLSKTQCVEGRNWGTDDGRVWVSGGCRGEFAEARGRGRGNGGGYGNGHWNDGQNQLVTCSSDDNRQRTCNWNQRGRPVVVEQLSRTQCVEGRNWGYDRDQIWVTGGCRARFGGR